MGTDEVSGNIFPIGHGVIDYFTRDFMEGKGLGMVLGLKSTNPVSGVQISGNI